MKILYFLIISILIVNLAYTQSCEILFTNNICEDSSPITLTGTPAGGVFSGPGVSGNSFDPVIAGGAGNYTITYTATACSADSVINVLPLPTSDFTLCDICEGDTSFIEYTGNASPSDTYNWTFPSGIIISGAGQGPLEVSWPMGSAVGSPYTCSLTVTDTNGCSSTYSTDIIIRAAGSPSCCITPIPYAGADDTICSLCYTMQAIQSLGYGTWTQIGGPGTVIIYDQNSPTSNVCVSTYGTYTFVWLDDNGPANMCTSCIESDTVVITFNDCVVINDLENKHNVNIYPNPTTGLITIKNEELRIMNVEVFDIYGKEVRSQKSKVKSLKYEMDLSKQSKGIYFIKVATSKGVVVEKVVLH